MSYQRAALLSCWLCIMSAAACQAVRTSPPRIVRVTLTVAKDGHSTRLPHHSFATLEDARDAIRALRRSSGLPRGGITVEIEGGEYERREPFVLNADDSGTAEAPIIYRASAGHTVKLVGGIVISRFAPVVAPSVLARLPEVARSRVRQVDLHELGIREFGSPAGGGVALFAAGVPLPLARWPNEGYTRIVDVLGSNVVDVRGILGDRSGRFMYEGTRPESWLDEPDVWLHGFWFWDWADERHRVASIDPAKRQIAVEPPLHHYGYRKGQWFYAYNILSELDRPGEWYLDRSNGLLYVWPPTDQQLVVSVSGELVSMRNASYVELRDLSLEASRHSAITITGGTNGSIYNCKIRDAGGWGIVVSGGDHHRIRSSEVAWTGQGGISVEGGNRAALAPGFHEVHGNHVHDIAAWNLTRQPAISISGVGNRVVENTIRDAPHTAILFGGNDHVIEFNRIERVCKETVDAGAIYAGRDWTMRGTAVRFNVLRDVGHCNGVYLDDMFSGTDVIGNVFIGVKRGVFIGGGRDNRVSHNIFLSATHPVHLDARGLGWAAYSIPTMELALSAVPYRDANWAKRYPSLARITREQPAAPRGNVIESNVYLFSGRNEIDEMARPFTAPSSK